MSTETPAPTVGQVWTDNDPRCHGRRTIRIDEITGATLPRFLMVAECTVLTDAQGSPPSGRAKTRIRIDRFRPTSNGYRFLRTEATQDGDQP